MINRITAITGRRIDAASLVIGKLIIGSLITSVEGMAPKAFSIMMKLNVELMAAPRFDAGVMYSRISLSVAGFCGVLTVLDCVKPNPNLGILDANSFSCAIFFRVPVGHLCSL